MRAKILIIAMATVLATMFSLSAFADSAVLTQVVQAGKSTQFSLELNNESATDQVYQLSSNGFPSGVTATFSQGGPVIDSVTVPAGSFEVVQVNVTVAADTPVGNYVGEFAAIRSDGTQISQLLALKIENQYALKIAAQTMNVSAFSGKEFSMQVTAANTGAAPLSNVAVKLDVPGKWLVKSSPLSVDTLAPGSTADFQITVLVPTSQSAVDQSVDVKVVSDQAESTSGKLIVRVQKSPNYLFASGGLVVLALGGVFMYFRRKGRR